MRKTFSTLRAWLFTSFQESCGINARCLLKAQCSSLAAQILRFAQDDRRGLPLRSFSACPEQLRNAKLSNGPAKRGHIAAAPLTISIISFVIFACRARFMASVSESIMSVALLVAESMAVMRAACSAATDSMSARKI